MNFINNNNDRQYQTSSTNHHHHFEKVKVRNENDIITLRRTFQNVYQEKLRDILKNQNVEQKTRTAYILRLSQLENSLFENVKKHVHIVKEDKDFFSKEKMNSNNNKNVPKSPVLETFDKNLKRSVDALEAKLVVLTKDVQGMRRSVVKKAVKVHSLADELEENDCFDENGELILNEEEEKELKLTSEKEKNDQNISDGTLQVFNKEIYNSLKRKVSMINQSVEDLVEGMPTILANAYHDLKSAEDVLNAPLTNIDIAMQTNLVANGDIDNINQQKILGAQKKKRKLLTNDDSNNNNTNNSITDVERTDNVSVNANSSSSSSSSSPRTNLRDLLLRS